MLKQDLENGMILETRNGDRHILVDNLMLDFEGFMTLVDYNEDLKFKDDDEEYDIVRVYRINRAYSLESMFEDKNLIILWERKETKLTNREIEVLKALKVLGYEWLARDDDNLFAYENEPRKAHTGWYIGYNPYLIRVNDSFNFIEPEDEEPTKIDDLLKGV